MTSYIEEDDYNISHRQIIKTNVKAHHNEFCYRVNPKQQFPESNSHLTEQDASN